MHTTANLAKYLNPWKLKREEAARKQRVVELRQRDGDNCQRCRRPLRFDVQSGHDQAPKFYELKPSANEALLAPLESLVMVHFRCNAAGAHNTEEVTERVRRKSEAELFSKTRERA